MLALHAARRGLAGVLPASVLFRQHRVPGWLIRTTAAGAKMATQQTFSFFDSSMAIAGPLQKRARATSSPATRVCQITPPAGPANIGGPRPSAKVVASPAEAAGSPPSRASILSQLRARVGCMTEAPAEPVPVFSTGAVGIDELLPRRGLKLDTLTEWVAETTTCGATTLAISAMASLLDSYPNVRGPVVVVDSEGTFYPPAALALGIPAERIVWVRPKRHADAVWAIDQALRCDSVAAVWAQVGDRLDDRDARRLQLAAEIGCTPGLLVRPSSVRGKPSFADVRFHVTQKGVRSLFREKTPDTFLRVWRVTLERCRGASVGTGAWIGMDEHAGLRLLSPTEMPCHDYEKTAAMRLASRLADPAVARGNTSTRRRA